MGVHSQAENFNVTCHNRYLVDRLSLAETITLARWMEPSQYLWAGH